MGNMYDDDKTPPVVFYGGSESDTGEPGEWVTLVVPTRLVKVVAVRFEGPWRPVLVGFWSI